MITFLVGYVIIGALRALRNSRGKEKEFADILGRIPSELHLLTWIFAVSLAILMWFPDVLNTCFRNEEND